MRRLSMLILVALAAPASVSADDTTVSKPIPLASAATAQKPSRAHDRLQLDSTAITGNRELPKVMSIVPWKEAEPPGGPDRPMNSLVDEILAPLDREEFQREVTYFRDLTSPASPVPSSPSPGVPKQ
jgi:hypothetical protein